MKSSISTQQTSSREADLREENLRLRQRVAELEARLNDGGPAPLDATSRLGTDQEANLQIVSQISPLLFESAPIGISLLRGGNLVCANRAYARILGYSDPVELQGLALSEMIAPDDRETVLARNLARERGLPVAETVEGIALRKDGTQANLQVSVAVIDLPDGPASLGLVMDITSRKQAEQRLQDTLDLNQKIITSAQAAILAYRRDGQCVLANEAAARIVNTTVPVLLQQNLFQLESWRSSGLRQLAETVFATGQPAQLQAHTITTYGREVWLNVRMTLFTSSAENHLLVMMEDITERVLAETALQQSETRFRTSIEAILDGFAIFSAIRDDSGRIVDFRYDYINEAGCQLNKRTQAEQVGHTMLELLPNHEQDGLLDQYAAVVETGTPFCRESLVYQDMYGGGRQISRAFDFQAVKLGDGFAVTWRDVTERKINEQKLYHLSNHDTLTGLYNRNYFTQALRQIEQDSSARATVLMIDVDGMKGTNDTLGHRAGDELLERTSRVLRSVFRKQDVVARIGGDEFAVILPDLELSVDELVCRIQSAITNENQSYKEGQLHLSIGGGVAGEGISLQQALDTADTAMYACKRTARVK